MFWREQKKPAKHSNYATLNIIMLPVETSSYVEENMASAHPDQKISPSSVSNAILLKSPKYAMHPPQHPSTDKHQQQKKPIHPSTFSHLHANSSTSATVSVTSQEYYSSQNNSSHSKNSTASAGSNDGSGDNNSKSSSNGNIVVSSFSNLATQSIGQGKYRQALEYYQLALQDYLKEKTTVVELVNAAATCFNLGALAKKLHEYPQAADYFDQAQHMYERSRTLVEKHIQTTRGNTHLLVATESVLKSTSSISSSSCQVCLLQLIVETLHARAHLHYKYQFLVNDAIECHEQVIELLEDSSQSVRYDDIYYCRIQFTVISQQWRWQFLCTSLQALGKFYVEKGEIEDAIIAYQDTLSILKKLNNFSIESNEQRQQEILQILRALSDIFMQSNIKCTDVKKLEQSALLQENINDWDKAMQCWERVVYCQSKEYGEESFEVSLALAQVGRVMVLEGNLEGGLDLYHAAANISFKNQKEFVITGSNTTKERSVTFMPEHIFLGVLNLYNELDRNPDAISWLKSLISVQCVRREDTARIQLELGKLYLIQGLLHAASDSLSLSLELFDEEDNSAFEYLKKVKALQNQNDTDNYGEKFQDDATFDTPNNNDDACVTASRLTAITEDGESALASVSTILNEDNNIVANDKIMPDDSEEVFDDSICTDPNALDNETDQSIFAKTEENQNKVNSGAAKETTNTTREVREHEINTVEELLPSDEDTSSSTDDPLNKNGINSNQSEIPDLETSNSHFEGSDSIRSINNDPKDNGVNNPFHLDIRPRIDEDDDVLTQQNIISGEYDVTPTTLITETSRTGLLNHVEKDTSLISLTIPRISSSSPKHSKTKDRKGYTEIKMLEKHSGSIGKRRIVKALASSFRRSRSKSRSVPGNLLGPVDEEKAVYPSTPVDKTRKAENDNVSLQSTNAPVSFIDLLSISDDESLVSQLTFKQEELLSKRKEPNSHWWWGVTVEGLSYVNQAVEAAEGWLSAKAIHESVKSPPLDFDSDDESDCVGEDFSLLKDASLNHAVTKKFTNEALVHNKLPKSVNISSQLGKSSVESSAVKDTINSSNSGSYKTPSLECQIKEKELVLKGKKIEDGSDDVSVAAVLFDLAGLYKKKKEFTNAMMYYRKAYHLQKSTLNLPQACDSLCLMAEVHCQNKRYKESISCYSEAQRIRQTIHGTYLHPEIAHILNQWGDVLSRQGEFDLAMEKHKEALRILRGCCGENSKNPLVSQTLIQIGNIYYKERNSLANIQCKNNDGYSTFIEGGMLEVIGRAHEDRGSYRMAIAFFEEKLQFLNDAENSNDLADVAETLNSLGMLSCRAGMYLEVRPLLMTLY